AAEGRSQRQRQSAQVCRRGAHRRADGGRWTGVDPEIRRHHRARIHPCRHLGAGGDQPAAVDHAAAVHRRADDAGAAAGGRRRDAGDLRADRAAAQLRQHRRAAAAARHRRRLQDLLCGGVARGQDKPAADVADTRDLFQRPDHGDSVRQPVALKSSGHREHGQAARAFARHHARG
ncbi:hypothetical protein KXV85_004565, partial [Aspergillus fumigatus]